jgi:predicted ester cyclase
MSNIDVVRAYVAAFNAGEWETLRTLFTTDALIAPAQDRGEVEPARPIWRELREWTGLHLKIEALTADGDTVAARFTETGRFNSPLGDLPEAAPDYALTALEWFEFAGGKIARRWSARDFASITRQVRD